MSDNRWQRVEDTFHRAVELAPHARSAFLDQVCGEDIALRTDVDSLLKHDAEDGRTFVGPAAGMAADALLAGSLSVGERLGPYEISGFIGAGGMGEVYRAYDSRLHRHIALKILPVEISRDPESRRRFEQEARAAAALNHPYIAAIYGLEGSDAEPDGVYAIAMELVEGSTLAQRIAALGRFPARESMAIANQMAEALAYAHEKGIVHRDLKPANVMVTAEGRIKLLDFGLAGRVQQGTEGTAVETGVNTGEVKIAGTIGYMSPEQVRGFPADGRTDLFSFGVVLYEMVTGERPFTGSSARAVCDAIQHAPPRDFGNGATPERLKAIVQKLLEKDPTNRYGSAQEVHRELKALERSLSLAGTARLAWTACWITIVLACVLAIWLWHRWSREQWAHEMAPEVARLVDLGEYVKAAELAQNARAVLPNDRALKQLWTRATGEVSVATVPSDVEVSFRPYHGDPNTWKTLGNTPLKKVRVPLDSYLWRLAKPGFAALFFLGKPAAEPPPGYHFNFNLKLKLRPEGSVPPEMVVVAGGRIGLGYPFGTAVSPKIDDFLIERHEVTNQDYRKFVDAGGYRNRDFWKQPFVKDGRTISWHEAMTRFHDSTGRPGPATWEAGAYPKGHDQYPVAGISWYEAAAYAEFAGKSLPTAYHWTLASQSAGFTPLIASGSNFRREGTQQVGSESAVSGFGTTDMAGNVKEWCWNEARDGKKFILGGGFGEPNYMFYHTDAQPPWDRLPNYGFRCVKLDSPPVAAATARIEAITRDYWKEKPVSDEIFKAYSELYAYDKSELNKRVEERISSKSWSIEKVSFDAAYGHERVIAYLYLPPNASQPFQTVVYCPGAGAYSDEKLDLTNLEDTRGFLVKSGRALLIPIFKGMFQRRDGLVSGGKPPAFFRDHVIAWSKDLGRSIDYLETRKEIDSTKVAYFGDSGGAILGALLPALEKRLKAEILSSGGFNLRYDLPEAAAFNFVKHVTIPVLMLNGRYDSTFPLESSQRPLFHFLGTPVKDKKHVIYEDGHGAFPRPQAVRETLDWLDRYLGPVRH